MHYRQLKGINGLAPVAKLIFLLLNQTVSLRQVLYFKKSSYFLIPYSKLNLK